MKVRWLLIAYMILSGCLSVKLSRFADIDQNEKTVSMSAGGLYLTGDLKAALMKDGWKVYAIDKAKEVVRGMDDPNAEGKKVVVYRESEIARKARYHLVAHWVMPSPNSYSEYDISLIDNNTGQEVIILSGVGKCGDDIVKIFIDALHGKEYQGWDRVR